MSYSFIDGNGSILTAESSVVLGGAQRQVVTIGSVLLPLTTTFSGSPSISGAVTIVGTPSISGQVGASVIGTVPVTQVGAWSASLVGTIPGSVVAFQGTTPWVVSSVYGNVSGSVVAFQGTTPWAVTNVGSVITTNIGSVITTNVGSIITVSQSSSVIAVATGSVVALQGGTWVASVFTTSNASIGTAVPATAYFLGGKDGNGNLAPLSMMNSIPDSGSGITTVSTGNMVYNNNTWDRLRGNSSVGAFVSPGIRNDTLSSIYGLDNIPYRAAFGPAGEMIVSNAPLTKGVRGTADLRVVLGASVTAIAAQGASIFTYITGVQVANMGSASVLVTLAGGLGSILAYTIAPAGGGSNIVYPTPLKTGANSAFTASISGTASVLVSAQGFIAKI